MKPLNIFFIILILNTLNVQASVNTLACWIRNSTGPNGAAYCSFKTTHNDKLIKILTPVCKYTELHNHIHEGNIKRMRQIKYITISPKKLTELKPGSLHIMLMQINTNLIIGDSIPLKLIFEKSKNIELILPIKNKK